jgi:Flp pilus assembly protein TadG
MRTEVPASRLTRVVGRFSEDRRANVAIIFALALIPIVGCVGAGIDYGHAISVRTALQAALDSTALMLSKSAATSNSSQLQSTGQNYFKGLFDRPDVTNVTINATYSTASGQQVIVNGSAQVATFFMQILGYNSLTVTGSSTTTWGMSRLRVALVLDNTGSMAQSNKITELKSATNNLLTQLQNAAASNGDVYVSIIPFVKDVNIDPSNSAASWIDWTDWDANNGTCSGAGGGGGGGGGGFGSSHGSMGSSQSTCSGTWKPANHNTWNGCVMDRGDTSGPDPQNYDTNVVLPALGIAATQFTAEQYSACPQAAMGLSYDWSSMTKLVNKMQPNGNTNQAIGLALGWMSLTGGGPFTAPAMDPNYSYNQVIIILTDGLNTQDRWYSAQSQIDARQTMTCNNIKASGITIYTVQVSTDGTPVSPLLQQCASDSSKFFFLTSSTQIVTTFNQIGTNLSQLYIAK